MKRLLSSLVVLCLILLLVGCSRDSPEAAAKEWVQAFADMDGNRMAARTCLAQQENLQEAGMLVSVFSILGDRLTNQQIQVDISELKFTTTSSTDDSAQVHVTGPIRVAILAISQAQEINETWHMVREDGAWKWCGQ